jgi:hypothetical protein
MNIIKTIDQYKGEHIYFCDPIKNNIMNDSNFIRIIYSTPYFSLNGVYLLASFVYLSTDKYYNKFKCTIDIERYKDTIDRIFNIEHNLLKKINIKHKSVKYKISEQLRSGIIKIFSNNSQEISNQFLLKIAGIWETEYEYGLTYKFISL